MKRRIEKFCSTKNVSLIFFSGCFLFDFCSLTFGNCFLCDVHGVLIMPLPLPLGISYSCLKLLHRPQKNDFYIGTIWLCSV